MSISGSVSTNKTWFITGTSSGLGRIMTERLLDRGDRVAATVRRDDALADLQQKHLERLSVMKLDLRDSIGIRATVDQAFRRLGRIDVVVSNAAYGLVGAAEELTDMQIDRQIATILPAPFSSSEQCYLTFVSKEVAESCRFRPRVVRWRTELQPLPRHQMGHRRLR